MIFSDLCIRMRALFRRNAVESELDEELSFHCERQVEKYLQSGLRREEAVRRARLEFGGIVQVKEDCRQARGTHLIETLFQDIRYGARQLCRRPGFTVVAVLTLALGIGANTAMFTLVDAVMLRPLPVPHPEQLYRLGDSDNCCQMTGSQGSFVLYSYPLYRYLRSHTADFSELAAFSPSLNTFSLRRSGTSGAAKPYAGEYVSGNYFKMFGVHAAQGRVLTDADDRDGASPVAVLSYHAWRQNFGRDPSVTGAAFTVNGQPVTIVGVAPSSFFGDTLRGNPPDLWIPLSREPVLNPSGSLLKLPESFWLYPVGRIKPGERPAQAQAHMTVELHQWLRNYLNIPAQYRHTIDEAKIVLTPAASGVTSLRSAAAAGLLLLTMVSGIVLLIACANIANLLLARGMANRHQGAIRSALGAGRSRLVGQTLIEGLLLALLGGAAGLAVAFAGTRGILLLVFRDAVYVPIDPAPSLLVLGFAFLLSLLTGAACSAVPAWMGSRTHPIEALRDARSLGGGPVLLRKTLVVLQAALSVVLLVGAALLTESLYNLEHQQFGFMTQGRLLVRIDPALAGYSRERLDGLYRQIQERLKQIPGVLSVGLSDYSPLEGNNPNERISIEGQPTAADPDDRPSISWDRVSAGYFETIGTRVVRGRSLSAEGTSGSRHEAVINEAFARKFFPDEDPIGRHFGMGDASHSGDFEIVGMVQDAKYTNASEPVTPMFFLSLSEPPAYIHDIELRLAGKPEELDPSIRRVLDRIDPNLTVLGITSLRDQVDLNFYRERLSARLTLLYGLLALALASVGLYGVLSYLVARRTSEIGVRMVLGAGRTNVAGMVLRDALSQIGLGLAVGLPVALILGHALLSTLYGVKSYDLLVLAAAAAALLLCALVAALVPAWRAMKVDPMIALRYE